MLDEADQIGFEITNLALQKLLYFCHGMFLIESKRPLVSGYFETWQYGPVHPSVYQSFKMAGSKPINFRATRQNLMTGAQVGISPPTDTDVIQIVKRIMSSYGRLTPGRLVEVSHAKDAPWHYVVNNGRTSEAFGNRIPDDIIMDRDYGGLR